MNMCFLFRRSARVIMQRDRRRSWRGVVTRFAGNAHGFPLSGELLQPATTTDVPGKRLFDASAPEGSGLLERCRHS